MAVRIPDVSPKAESALNDAAAYSQARWGYGRRCLDAFQAVAERLAEFPFSGSEIEAGLHRVPFPAPFPFWILYRPSPTLIEIVDVVPMAAGPERWSDVTDRLR